MVSHPGHSQVLLRPLQCEYCTRSKPVPTTRSGVIPLLICTNPAMRSLRPHGQPRERACFRLSPTNRRVLPSTVYLWLHHPPCRFHPSLHLQTASPNPMSTCRARRTARVYRISSRARHRRPRQHAHYLLFPRRDSRTKSEPPQIDCRVSFSFYLYEYLPVDNTMSPATTTASLVSLHILVL